MFLQKNNAILSPLLKNTLKQLGISYSGNIRLFSVLNNKNINFSTLLELDSKKTMNLIENGNRLTANHNIDDIWQFTSKDIPSNHKGSEENGQILYVANKPGELLYAEKGKILKDTDSLVNKYLLPANQLIAIQTLAHTPFKFNFLKDTKFFAKFGENFEKVLSYQEIKNQYSLNKIADLTKEQANVLSKIITDTIDNDPNKEYFFDEITSKKVLPSESLPTSITAMTFEEEQTSPTHYHPTGERMLIIATTDKPSGAILNFCGVSENPEKHKDTEQKINFPSNSLITLRFPAYVHHKFIGSFNCLSVHPKEGKNMIAALKDGSLNKGFLEMATVISDAKQKPSDIIDSINKKELEAQTKRNV
jgi:hypothetical protein